MTRSQQIRERFKASADKEDAAEQRSEVVAQVLSPGFQSRFHVKYERKGDDECWNWTTSKANGRYGTISLGLKKVIIRAPAASWITHNKRHPGNLFVCHSCDNPACVNPKHLWLGTNRDNIIDCLEKGRHIAPSGDRNGSRTQPWAVVKGEDKPNAKLNAISVRSIRSQYKQGAMILTLARTYNVHTKTIERVLNNVTWKHIE